MGRKKSTPAAAPQQQQQSQAKSVPEKKAEAPPTKGQKGQSVAKEAPAPAANAKGTMKKGGMNSSPALAQQSNKRQTMATREEPDPFDPYADVFGLSSSGSASSAPNQSLERSSSPFSPLGHVAAAPNAVDVFAPAAAASGPEGILLSFSPLAQPAAASSTSGTDRFSSFQGLSSSGLPPPPAQPQRPASFSGSGVSEGQLLSFSPVATLPPAPSFFASSAVSGSTASGSSAFGNDDLFSLSMDLSMSATSVASTSSTGEKQAEPAPGAMDLTQTPPSAFSFMDSASSSHSSSGSATAFGMVSSDQALPVQHDVFAAPLHPFALETSDEPSLRGSFVSPEPLNQVDSPPAQNVDVEAKSEVESHEAQDGLAEIDLLQAGGTSSYADEMTFEATAEAADLELEAVVPASFQVIPSSQASDSDSTSGNEHPHEEQVDAFESFAAVPDDVALEKSQDSFSFSVQAPADTDPEVVVLSGNDTFSFGSQEQPSVSNETVPEAVTFQGHIDTAPAQFDCDDGFGDYGRSTEHEIDFHAVVSEDKPLPESSSSAFNAMESDEFGGFARGSSPAAAAAAEATGFGDETSDGFGDFAQSSNGFGDDDDDGFGDFAQSSGAAAGDDEDDGFGDFSSGGFQASSSSGDDDGFGDFASPPPQAPEVPSYTPSIVPQTLNIPIASKQDVADFFTQAFAASSSSTGKQLLDSAGTGMPVNSVQLFQEQPGNVNHTLERVFISELSSYCASASADQSSANTVESMEDVSESKTLSLKYLKYVLTAKIQEATRYNGIFPDGSEKHQHFEAIANSGNEDAIRAAVAQLQEELFHSSVNDAMMRLAKQAALSAKAKIAEQAALQQANSRTSILTTTRNLLTRGGGGASERDVSSSNASGSNAPSAASGGSNKSARSSGHEDSMGGSGDETGGSDGPGDHLHSGHNSDPETHTATASAPRSTGSGGLMKKFQDRFSPFSSSRSKPRTVSLRRMGESGEEVRTMEINMDSINGGFDEVKWKCAVFLYDMEEVAHVAPSQIQILSYPGKQLLSGKSDRSALVKFLKPGTIWSIDIGANNSDVLNEW